MSSVDNEMMRIADPIQTRRERARRADGVGKLGKAQLHKPGIAIAWILFLIASAMRGFDIMQ